MQRDSGPERGARPGASYASPNAPFGADWEPRHAPAIEVVAPRDLVRRGEEPAAPTVVGVDPGEHQRVRERVSFLEGALESAARVEATARGFADRLEERARQSREQYERDLGGLREQLEHKERELRTLALEMGKLQGRLEATQAKLLAPREPRPSDTAAATAAGEPPRPSAPRHFLETERGLFLSGVALAFVLFVVSALVL